MMIALSRLLRGAAALVALFLLLGCGQARESTGGMETPHPAADDEPVPVAAAALYGFTTEGFLYAGSPSAALVVYEMFNANCPGCAHHHTSTLDDLIEAFGRTGQVRFVLVDLPISAAWGEEAHFAAFCVGEQQGAEAQWRFWSMFYRDQSRWLSEGRGFTEHLGSQLGVETERYQDCFENRAQPAVYAAQQVAEEALLPNRWATPAFRIEDRDGRFLRSLSGSPGLEAWTKELNRHLN